jgi:hypothetical protein
MGNHLKAITGEIWKQMEAGKRYFNFSGASFDFGAARIKKSILSHEITSIVNNGEAPTRCRNEMEI